MRTGAVRSRVLLVGPSVRTLGGQSVQLQRLLVGLRSTGINATALDVDPELSGPFRGLAQVRYVRTVARSIVYLAHLLREIRRSDVVHCYSASYWSFVLAPLPALLVGRLRGAGIVLNYHSGEAEDHLQRWRWLMRRALRLPDQLVVPSNYLVDVFARFGFGAVRIPNSIAGDALTYRRRTQIRPIFFCNRTHEPMYRVDDVLRAFELVQRECPDAELLVAGNGSQRFALEALARELGLRNVTFLGGVAPEVMAATYERADIFINASEIDNMPLSIMEANAAGLAVVSSDAGGIPWLVDHERTGLLARTGDYQALAHAALRLMNEDGLALRLSDAARDEFERLYTWEVVQAMWERCYADLNLTGDSDRTAGT